MTPHRSRRRIATAAVWLLLAAGQWPVASAAPPAAEPARADPPKADRAKDLDEAVDLVTSRPRLQALRPDNVRQRLATVVPAGAKKWNAVKTELTWKEETGSESGAVEKVSVVFEPADGKPGDWHLKELFIELRGGETATQVKELAGKVQQRLGKPRSGRPRGNKATDITWSLKGAWTAHVAVQPIQEGKPLTLLLYVSTLASDVGD
jgi:hypothetical protein